MALLTIIYWAGLVIEIIIRAPFQKTWKTTPKTEQRVSIVERALLNLIAIAGVLLPLVYSVTPWLDFANYRLPPWLGWVGVLLLACGLFVFARAHRDLKSNWTPTLQIFAGHELVTRGIYGRIRHPMYASQWIFSLAQIVLLQNWIAGPAGLIVWIPFYFLRVRAEEKMMLETFGAPYRQYMRKTGSILPKF